MNKLLACALPLSLALTFTSAQASPAVVPGALSSAKASALATEAVAIARRQGYNVSATVVDDKGVILAVARADQALGATPKTSFKKAVTAIVAKQHTADFLDETFKQGPAFLDRFVISTLASTQDNIVLLRGGVLIKDNDSIIGAIGIGGAPGGHLDHAIGLQAIGAVLR